MRLRKCCMTKDCDINQFMHVKMIVFYFGKRIFMLINVLFVMSLDINLIMEKAKRSQKRSYVIFH